jgi:preprotein translocase subunit SecG
MMVVVVVVVVVVIMMMGSAGLTFHFGHNSFNYFCRKRIVAQGAITDTYCDLRSEEIQGI